MNKNTKSPPAVTVAPASLSPTITPPPGQHRQVHGSEARVVMQAIGVNASFGKVSDVITPNSSSMLSYANQILRNSALPQIATKVYAPNEMAGLLHDLQTRLGL